MRVTYTTIWDDTEEIETYADYNPQTNQVTDVEEADCDDLDIDILTSEYITLPDGVRIEREDFLLEGEDF